MRRTLVPRWALLVLVAALVGCSSGRTVTAAEGFVAERIVTGLDRPTQMIVGPDGRLWVAQLAGGENAGRGQVVAVDLDDGRRDVLVDGLVKPTGLAWLDGALWIATPTAVLRAAGQPPGTPVPVVDGLPNNGRSNGTLTVTPDGLLLHETSGRERGADAVDGSGALWVLDPTAPDRRRRIASGLKNAYGHTYDDEGRLWTTEVAEPIGGEAAPDEINRIVDGADYGWPACVGERTPVDAFGGTEQRCAASVPPVVTFAPVGATPTSVVVSPFDPSRLIVALWNAGRVVSVAVDGSGGPRDLVVGVPRPQHLLVVGGALLVSDHAAGVVWRITASG